MPSYLPRQSHPHILPAADLALRYPSRCRRSGSYCYYLVSLFLRRCLRLPHQHQRHLGLRFFRALHSSTSFHGIFPRSIGYIDQDILALVPSLPNIDTPTIAGSAVGAGIHSPSSAARDLPGPRLRRARGGRPSQTFRVYLIHTRLASSTCVITSRLACMLSHLHRIAIPPSPPPPSALPGRSSY
ncbi:hypothetical protein OH76DRAFT_1020761 [Lentinus brumalis]|uniref:Uncharacterized protein n=1 Tax=Lentinus brumalis TaxID=2498619 RepID=A0A371CXX2_9APHY|nr:hypothetical protein OH76DRAFT_1020761 [Polyporus brumalis]